HVLVRENGVIATKPGTLQAGTNVLTVTVHGQGGHGSQPHNALDPVPAIGEMIGALQTMVTRSFDVFDPVVMSITRLSAGDMVNVIPASASLGATVRTLSDESVTRFREDRKSTRLNSSHVSISYAVFCLKQKRNKT